MMDILENETKIDKNRWPLWFGLSLLFILGIGLSAVVKFDDIEVFFKSNSVESVEQQIISGSEQQRLDALTLIKKSRLQVDVGVLKKVFSSDSSIRVRQLSLETLLRRLRHPEAKKYLEQVVTTESDPKILQLINYKLQKLTEEIRWLYKG